MRQAKIQGDGCGLSEGFSPIVVATVQDLTSHVHPVCYPSYSARDPPQGVVPLGRSLETSDPASLRQRYAQFP
jgi:hypothetical protein